MKKFFATRMHSADVDTVLLLTRLVVGSALMIYGSFKIQSPMTWMGPDSSVPGIFQALAALSEFGGGLALILGLLVRLAALGIVCTMAVAICMHLFVFHDPFVNLGNGGAAFHPASILLFALLFFVLGPGRVSIDRKIFGLRA